MIDLTQLIMAVDRTLPLAAMQAQIADNLLLGFSRTMQQSVVDAALVEIANDDTLGVAELNRALDFWRTYRSMINTTYDTAN